MPSKFTEVRNFIWCVSRIISTQVSLVVTVEKLNKASLLDVSCKNLIANNTYLSYSFIDNQLQIMMIAVKIFIGITAFQFFLPSMACIPGLRTSRGDLRGDGKKTIVKSSLFKG